MSSHYVPRMGLVSRKCSLVMVCDFKFHKEWKFPQVESSQSGIVVTTRYGFLKLKLVLLIY